jgi:protoporphyrin/coproporphyrin ferrochelatase
LNAVLVMAYGGPDRLDDVGPYILDVRNHRPTSPSVIEEMKHRYARIGGRSPIFERTTAQAEALGRALRDAGLDVPVRVGMRHWHPYIRDTLRTMEAAGVTRAVGLVMAPHYSRMSIGAYAGKVEQAGSSIDVRTIESWHLLPEFLDAVHDRVLTALGRFDAPARDRVPVIFTTHSLPERIVADGDPYPGELAATFDALRERLPGHECRFAYQSAAMTPDPWLGPDAGVVMQQLAAEGNDGIVIAPIGFTSDHVEILFDIDVEYRALADRLGVRLERIDMVNDDANMMRGLARLVAARMRSEGWL